MKIVTSILFMFRALAYFRFYRIIIKWDLNFFSWISKLLPQNFLNFFRRKLGSKWHWFALELCQDLFLNVKVFVYPDRYRPFSQEDDLNINHDFERTNPKLLRLPGPSRPTKCQSRHHEQRFPKCPRLRDPWIIHGKIRFTLLENLVGQSLSFGVWQKKKCCV